MTGISRLIRKHLSGIPTAIGSKEVAALWKRRPVPNCIHILAAFSALAALWASTANAQSYTIYVEPRFLYNATGTPYRDTLAAAWSDVQAAFDYCNIVPAGSTCYQVQNLHPDTTGALAFMLDGIWYWQYFDQQVCSTPTGLPTVCNTSTDWSSIQTTYVCPTNFGAGYYDTSTQNYLLACARTIPAYSQPPTKFCMSCLGNPIFASTGQKLQAETDYSGISGLNFTRTY
jgi:hypothetical protein